MFDPQPPPSPSPWEDFRLNGQLTQLVQTRPDGSKKAYVRLTPDVDALDIAANKLSLV